MTETNVPGMSLPPELVYSDFEAQVCILFPSSTIGLLIYQNACVNFFGIAFAENLKVFAFCNF
jgi:hypothetical protein